MSCQTTNQAVNIICTSGKMIFCKPHITVNRLTESSILRVVVHTQVRCLMRDYYRHFSAVDNLDKLLSWSQPV